MKPFPGSPNKTTAFRATGFSSPAHWGPAAAVEPKRGIRESTPAELGERQHRRFVDRTRQKREGAKMKAEIRRILESAWGRC
jgi:hypothetical protein